MITSATEIISVRSTSRSEARMVVDAVDRHGDVDGGRDRGLQLRQQRLDAVDRVDDVGAGLAIEDDQDGRLAVGEAGIAQILDRIDDIADVGQAHRRRRCDRRRPGGGIASARLAWSLS